MKVKFYAEFGGDYVSFCDENDHTIAISTTYPRPGQNCLGSERGAVLGQIMKKHEFDPKVVAQRHIPNAPYSAGSYREGVVELSEDFVTDLMKFQAAQCGSVEALESLCERVQLHPMTKQNCFFFMLKNPSTRTGSSK